MKFLLNITSLVLCIISSTLCNATEIKKIEELSITDKKEYVFDGKIFLEGGIQQLVSADKSTLNGSGALGFQVLGYIKKDLLGLKNSTILKTNIGIRYTDKSDTIKSDFGNYLLNPGKNCTSVNIGFDWYLSGKVDLSDVTTSDGKSSNEIKITPQSLYGLYFNVSVASAGNWLGNYTHNDSIYSKTVETYILSLGCGMSIFYNLIKNENNTLSINSHIGIGYRNILGEFIYESNADLLKNTLNTTDKHFFGFEASLGLVINNVNLTSNINYYKANGEIKGFSSFKLSYDVSANIPMNFDF